VSDLQAEALYEGLRTRHSFRRFADRPVPEGVLRRILWAGTRAPSAHNRQPWRFVVVTGRESRRRWVEAMGRRYREDLLADGLSLDQVGRHVSNRESRLLDAPAAVLLCMTMADMDRYPDATRQQKERQMAMQSVAIAGGYMLLAAHAEGLGGCWICAPLFGAVESIHSLDLDAEWEPQGVLAIGYPAGSARVRSRRDVAEVTLWR
jgi:coenzyme F420-0:L-glutamate ligase/coenzyme F420-1:gamma-L-glutamate ligase